MTTKEQEEELVIPCQVYSRVVGYLRPVEDWNKSKRLEYSQRVSFSLEKIAKRIE